MKRSGFTLVELIVTIALLGMVGIVISMNMISVINKEKDKDKAEFKSIMEEAACAYTGLSYVSCPGECTIPGESLMDANMIDEVVNGFKVKEYSVKVTYENNKKICTLMEE